MSERDHELLMVLTQFYRAWVEYEYALGRTRNVEVLNARHGHLIDRAAAAKELLGEVYVKPLSPDQQASGND